MKPYKDTFSYVVALFQSKIIDSVFPVKSGPTGLLKALHRLCTESEQAAREGYQLIVLSDRTAGKEYAPVRWVRVEMVVQSWYFIVVYVF